MNMLMAENIPHIRIVWMHELIHFFMISYNSIVPSSSDSEFLFSAYHISFNAINVAHIAIVSRLPDNLHSIDLIQVAFELVFSVVIFEIQLASPIYTLNVIPVWLTSCHGSLILLSQSAGSMSVIPILFLIDIFTSLADPFTRWYIVYDVLSIA